MRSQTEIIQHIMTFALQDERIRIVTMEGSRVNPAVQPDVFQDYDICFLVTDMDSFTRNDDWLDYFGKRIMMQKPEGMSLFPPELNGWFTYLMLFEDGNRIDLKLVPIEDLEAYLASDTLISLMLDKDDNITDRSLPDDRFYHIIKPSPACFDDCCNEFWWVSTYVVKGLFRKQFLYAVEHMERNVRSNLLRMLSWRAGLQTGFSVNLGKSYASLSHYMSPEEWELLLSTFNNASFDEIWQSLDTCHVLFRKVSSHVASALNYLYPDYDFQVSRYINRLHNTEI